MERFREIVCIPRLNINDGGARRKQGEHGATAGEEAQKKKRKSRWDKNVHFTTLLRSEEEEKKSINVSHHH